MQNQREAHMFNLAREVGKFGHVLAESGHVLALILMINEFKYGQTRKFGHLHLVYYFTVPLSAKNSISSQSE